jgi:hypothetical protein
MELYVCVLLLSSPRVCWPVPDCADHMAHWLKVAREYDQRAHLPRYYVIGCGSRDQMDIRDKDMLFRPATSATQ